MLFRGGPAYARKIAGAGMDFAQGSGERIDGGPPRRHIMKLQINDTTSLEVKTGKSLFSYFRGKTNRMTLNSLTLLGLEINIFRQRLWLS